MKITSLENLNLNRTASQLSLKELPSYAHIGMRWQRDDHCTDTWFPQGITGTQNESISQEWLFVAWYSKHNIKRGVRVSFIHLNPYSSKWMYRHVLLVDQEDQVLANQRASVHAGGLSLRKNTLYLTDTLTPGCYKIRIFPLSNIFEINDHERAHFFNYRYILRESSFIKVPKKPTFLSYDLSCDRWVTGDFHKDKPGNIAFFEHQNEVTELSSGDFTYFRMLPQMQGASLTQHHLFISQSYGRYNQGRLSWAPLSALTSNTTLTNSITGKINCPPGIQDLFYHQNSNNLWTHSEFPYRFTYQYQDRITFAFKVTDLIN